MEGYLMFLCLICSSAASSDFYPLRIGNPDDTEKIERPCPVYDWDCIREFFATHAHCTKTYGPVPDPFVRAQSNVYAARVNISATLIEETVRGLNGRIEEFYVNRDTDNMVFSIEFRNLNLTSDRTYFTFHRRGKEPITNVGLATINYGSIVVTAIIPKIDDLQLIDAEATVFVNTPANPNFIEPGVAASSDPKVPVTVTDFLSNQIEDFQELFFTDAFFYPAAFIQYNICDFDLQTVVAVAEFFTNPYIDYQELFVTDAFFYPAAFIQYNICDFGL